MQGSGGSGPVLAFAAFDDTHPSSRTAHDRDRDRGRSRDAGAGLVRRQACAHGVKQEPYESGVPALDENRKRVNVRFYQIAMLFILFDIEAAFLYPWAVIYREATTGTQGMFLFGEMLVFIALLAVGYIYVWKKKAFDF
jgi:NADH-quinone oxidoreductase subunit A